MNPRKKPKVTVLASDPIPERVRKYRSSKPLRRPTPRPKSQERNKAKPDFGRET